MAHRAINHPRRPDRNVAVEKDDQIHRTRIFRLNNLDGVSRNGVDGGGVISQFGGAVDDAAWFSRERRADGFFS